MTDSEKPEYDFLDHYRQARITKLMEIISQKRDLEGKNPWSHEAQEKLRKILNKYTSPELYEIIKSENLEIEKLSSRKIADRTTALHKAGILSRRNSGTANER